MKKKNLVLVALLALLVGLGAYGTVAYFSGEAHVTNVITTGTVNITLQETKADGSPWQDVDGIVSGETVDKLVWVENPKTDTAAPAWVRVQVTNQVETNGTIIQDDPVLSIDFNLAPADTADTKYWVKGENGWYYYSVPLNPGEKTELLFQNVTFDTSMGNEYQGATVNVDVTAQAVQYKNNQGAGSSPITQLTSENYTQIQGWPGA